MRNVLGPGTTLGYCTNVHAGATLSQVRENLDRIATRVQAIACPDEPLGIGLWLSDAAATELIETQQVAAMRDWLEQKQLFVFTLNGFPQHDFHEPVVKRAVYEPDWTTPERAAYTMKLITILAGLLPDGDEGSISTLPIGWPSGSDDAARRDRAIEHLLDIVLALRDLHQRTDQVIHLDLEPEPGCLLQRASDVVRLFARIDELTAPERTRPFLRICHDVCHAAVMFENQAETFEQYEALGIRIGKVQISSAIRADLQQRSAIERTQMIAALREFAEDRYLHQTMVRDGDSTTFHEDLPAALDAFSEHDRAGDEWRVHFHVPVHLNALDGSQTTRDHINQCLHLLASTGQTLHFEVETYAWNALPESLRPDDLASGIADELKWVRGVMASLGDTTS